MTIKELEARTGMTRANIRFYEQEGLLSPARLPNGYRDYSEADAATLEKIKLFRQLRLDLDTIRALQRGDLALNDALSSQLRALDQDRAVVDAARQVCARLRSDRAEYATLDPRPYLAELERGPREAPHVVPPAPDRLPTVAYPWRRFFARSLDMALYSFLIAAVRLLVFHDFSVGDQTLGANLLRWILDLILLFALEPLLLSRLGTTPGKWLFGLEVRTREGTFLSYSDALERTCGVYVYGLGWMIPIWELYRQWKSYQACKAGEALPWENGLAYTIRDTRRWRAAVFAVLYLSLLFPLPYLAYAQAMLPPNRGDLTQAEYIENCNFALRYYGIDERLNEQGQWTEVPSSYFLSPLLGEHEILTDETGVVTGVRIQIKAADADHGYYSPDLLTGRAAFLALAGARNEVNCFRLFSILQQFSPFEAQPFEPRRQTIAGIQIEVQSESSGYALHPHYIYALDEEEDHFFSYTITFTLP